MVMMDRKGAQDCVGLGTDVRLGSCRQLTDESGIAASGDAKREPLYAARGVTFPRLRGGEAIREGDRGERARGCERAGSAVRSLRPRATPHIEVQQQKGLRYASIG